MSLLKILILAVIQGLAELLPVSSSAHVIVAERLLGLDPADPEMTLLLVLLHTGTMLAVVIYFWSAWKRAYFSSAAQFWRMAGYVVLATAATGFIGLALQSLIKHGFAGGDPNFQIEQLFGNLHLIAGALAVAGLLIIAAGVFPKVGGPLTPMRAAIIGAVQGLSLPFRGFSRSGATISAGMLAGTSRQVAEEFSFALAVVLTPVVVAREGLRYIHADGRAPTGDWIGFIWPALLGLLFSFLAGLVALRWLSGWLQTGKWHFFGFYCLVFAGLVFWLGN